MLLGNRLVQSANLKAQKFNFFADRVTLVIGTEVAAALETIPCKGRLALAAIAPVCVDARRLIVTFVGFLFTLVDVNTSATIAVVAFATVAQVAAQRVGTSCT